MMDAIGYLNIGHLDEDIKSSAYLFDIYNVPMLFSKYADNEKAKELLIDLKTSKTIAAKIRVQSNCFNADPIERVFKNCRPACRWAEKLATSETKMDVGSISALKGILNQVY